MKLGLFDLVISLCDNNFENKKIYADIVFVNDYGCCKQVSVVMWLAPRPSVRETRVQIPEQHGNLVKFILVWVFFNPSGILTQP